MPFAIWCTSCPRETLIPQGVRFNAEKQRVGAYYSTPIYAFRMKHTACGNTIEIRTDPANTAYVVTEGARKKDTGEDRPTEGVALQFRTEEERARLRDDAFAALEVTIDDRRAAKAEQDRVAELQAASNRDWDDPYRANQNLRRSFRVGRKAREVQAGRDDDLRERMGWHADLEIAAETNDDRRRAKEIEFGRRADMPPTVSKRALFAGNDGIESSAPKSKKEALQSELSSNTRAVVDPFTTHGSAKVSKDPVIPGLKRKRRPSPTGSKPGSTHESRSAGSLLNIDYDSD